MHKEIVEQKQKIIQHIQLKLAQLRQNRNKIQQKKYPHLNTSYERKTRPSSVKIDKPNIIQKRHLENNLANLQRLYEGKKQLRKAGIITNNPTQIYKYQNDPKLINQLQKKKKKVAQDAQKMKIINQQMAKAEKFLKSKKVANIILAQLQQMNYKKILQQKSEQLRNYEQLVLKKSLNRIQKEQLIQLTFQMLRQWNQVLKKQKLKKFLFANPQFCGHFFITHAQINRDLEVVSTKQAGIMDYREFLQFVKSIQVTNPRIQPCIKRKIKEKVKQQQIVQKQNKKAEQKGERLNDRQLFRKILQYMRKLFKNLDRSNQSLVDRQKFILGVQKGLFLDPEKDKYLKKQQLKKLSTYITQKTKQKCLKSYYNQLDAKFITFGEIQTFCRQYFLKNQRSDKKQESSHNLISKQESQVQQNNQEAEQQQNYDQKNQQQSEKSQQFDLSSKQGKIITEQDYRRYGWNRNKKQQGQVFNNRHPILQLNNMDSYYKQVGQKYGGQIAWAQYRSNSYKYKEEFKQLQAFIRQQENKNSQFHKKCTSPK